MSETVIVGGGVIGLTSAYMLAKKGVSVTVIDRQTIGQEASWAGAGMLPPSVLQGPAPLKVISRLSTKAWPQLSQELLTETGIDNGYRNCGSIQISLDAPENLEDNSRSWTQQNIPVELLNPESLRTCEPSIHPEISCAYRLPTMSQVRNPHHLKALKKSCIQNGVRFVENQEVHEFEIDKSKIVSACLDTEKISAETFVITAGAWSKKLLTRLDISFEIIPIRGQIVLMKLRKPIFEHIIEDGPRYLVPREDGYLLIGSTEENAGFIKETTDDGIQGLLKFALQVVPKLSLAEIVKSWAGLRPHSQRGFPLIGQSDLYENLVVAAGHFRDGLFQSPMTAQLVSELVTGQTLSIELGPLSNFRETIVSSAKSRNSLISK